MAFSTGTTTGFSGTTGLLQTLIAYITGATYTDTLGTGDAVTTVFAKTVANTPVALGQCRIRFKIAGVLYQVWDNGLGVFTHTKISSGTIVYATGAINITFTNAPDSGYVMGILYCLSTNGAGRDWIILRNTTAKNSTGGEAFPGDNPCEYVIKNSGSSYSEDIIIGLREFKYVAGTHYGIQMNVYKTWRDVEEAAASPWNANSADTGNAGYDATRQAWGTHPTMPLNETNMAYWIFSSKRRIMVVARVSGTVYEAFYAGGAKRFSSPSKYPHPNIVMGTVGDSATTFSSTSANHSFFIWPNFVPGCFLSLLPNDTYDKGTNVTFYPKRDFGATGTLKKTPTNKIILYPVYAIQRGVAPFQLLFELDGAFFTPFTSLAAEDILEIGADDYLIVPNIFRTTYQDYMGLLEA